MVLMAAVVGLALGLVSSVRSDIEYALQPNRAELLGDAIRQKPAALPSNAYVVVRGTPMLSGMVRFESGLFGREYVVFPLAGQRNVFVQVPAESLNDPRTASSTEFAGRMVTFGELGGRFRVVREFLAARMTGHACRNKKCRDVLTVSGGRSSQLDHVWSPVVPERVFVWR